ncbi:MAG: hypothetical protein ACRD9L_12620, partial [Bryobacteraceae bacterium]
MKSYLFFLMAAAYALSAQTPQPATPATPAGQRPAEPATPEAPAHLPPSLTIRPAPAAGTGVVAEVDGQKLTAADVKKL